MERVFKKEELQEVAVMFWELAGDRKIFAFEAEMGVGKTSLIAAISAQKKIHGSASSPTFSLINEYPYEEDGEQKLLIHMDLYRLRDEEEARQAGVEDYLYSGAVCLVEWPEKAPGLFPPETVTIRLTLLADGARKLIIS